MGFIIYITIKTVMLAVFIILACFKGSQAQIQQPVIILENKEVELTIIIPELEQNYIVIKHTNGLGKNQTGQVLFLMLDGRIKMTDDYSNKLTATLSGKTMRMLFKWATAADAGWYRCHPDGYAHYLDNCGQLLIVIRKPQPPTVRLLPSSSTTVGSDLQLQCETHSTSLPPNHNLTSEIWWHDGSNQYVPSVGIGQRIYVDPKNLLVIKNLERTDKGLKFYCISADNAGDENKRNLSDKSNSFEVIPEYMPSNKSFILSPVFEDDDTIKKVIDERISYRCEADCQPLCDITWMYKPSIGSSEFVEMKSLNDRKDLVLTVDRTNGGSYLCRANNRHGVAMRGFILDVLYLEAPIVSINGANQTSLRFPENSPVTLTCIFESNPAPEVSWISPRQMKLVREKASLTQDNGLHKHVYKSSYTSNELTCEDSGIFRCEGKNTANIGEGRMDLTITCKPSSADIPGLGLMKEYAWEISKPLNFQFVIQAFPEPDIERIVSHLNGLSQVEEFPDHVQINKISNYDGKAYLTKFDFTSRRSLTHSDSGRIYTMTINNKDFKSDFQFEIISRGPPRKISNLTATNIGHDSVMLKWYPGFNGGETQTFSVEHRVLTTTEHNTKDGSYVWIIAVQNIPDGLSDSWIEAKVESLSSNTDYMFRVNATNQLGSSEIEMKITTVSSPDDSLGAGAICGIVFAILFIAVVTAVLIYIFVYKRRFRKDGHHQDEGPEAKKIMIPDQLARLFWQDKNNTEQPDDSTDRPNGSLLRKSPWEKVKVIFQRNTIDSREYANVPQKCPAADDNDNSVNGDPEYVNLELREPPRDTAEASPINNNDGGNQKPQSNKKRNSQGLVYIDVEFPANDKTKKNKKDKQKKKQRDKEDDRQNRVNYADIDFKKTAAKRKEIEEAEQRQKEEEYLHFREDDAEENIYENFHGGGPGTTV